MEACSEQADCPHFGLLVGQRGRLSSFGLVGYLAMHSPAVGVALESIVRYLHLHVQGAGAVLEQSGDTGFLGYEILQPIASGFDQVEDGALATTHNILRELCGSDWAPSEVWFTHREPPDKGPFRQFFHSLLRFDRARAGLFFPAKWLKCPVSAADPELRRILQKQVDHLERRFRNDFPAQVRRVLHNALLTRHASAEEVAAIFSIHSRTLHRRLKVHGTTFKVLAEDCRYQIARQMLESSDAPLIRVAEMLDYADTKAFGRAFRGFSASHFRSDAYPFGGAPCFRPFTSW